MITPAGEAFCALYDQQVERIYRYLLAHTGCIETAEDLTAETFRAALESFGRIRTDEPAAPWLAGIARHKLADYYRREKPLARLEVIHNLEHPGPSPEDEALHRLEMARVSKALRSLNNERAEALTLHYFAGLNLADVGRAMQRSEEAAKKLVQRGLAELREKLR